MNGLFGGNSCTWVLILVIVFLLSQRCDGGCAANSCASNSCGCINNGYDNHGCGCGCGC